MRLSADVRLVLVPLHVTDRTGRSVTGLTREHFRVYDESGPREIQSFTSEDAPVSLGIVLDTSASMTAKLSRAIEALRVILGGAGPEDEQFLVTCSSRPELRLGFTADSSELERSVGMIGARGNTALIDSVWLALEQVRRGSHTRRALLVISDGGDNHSRHSFAELLAAAVEADTQIYSIALHERTLSHDETLGAFLLEKLSSATGGLHFELRNRAELPVAAEKIALALHNVYVLGFQPAAGTPAGKWRRIKVRLEAAPAQFLRVNARSGYYNPE